MAKSTVLNKEYRRRTAFSGHFLRRCVNNSFIKDISLSIGERQFIYQKITKIPYSVSVVRLKNYCVVTGHSRSVYRDVKLSRHKFNQMVLNGNIPGWFLASW
ncbi:MAG: hypothetical protein CMP47_12070 [Rickettsiales bacterium]|jgi:small subunit ribosomal protein S14|nr:hypothetical protein [Rickettsiales bacterium]